MTKRAYDTDYWMIAWVGFIFLVLVTGLVVML
jgi:hypothetical protein